VIAESKANYMKPMVMQKGKQKYFGKVAFIKTALIQHNLAGISWLKHQDWSKLRILMNSINTLFATHNPPACMVGIWEKCR